jgi:hypothetical protein
LFVCAGKRYPFRSLFPLYTVAVIGDEGLHGFITGVLHVLISFPHPLFEVFIVFGCHVVCVGLLSPHPGFLAITIQLPAICFSGFGSLIHALYGQKQTATPADIVSVGVA